MRAVALRSTPREAQPPRGLLEGPEGALAGGAGTNYRMFLISAHGKINEPAPHDTRRRRRCTSEAAVTSPPHCAYSFILLRELFPPYPIKKNTLRFGGGSGVITFNTFTLPLPPSFSRIAVLPHLP